jgi:hypothetical protein
VLSRPNESPGTVVTGRGSLVISLIIWTISSLIIMTRFFVNCVFRFTMLVSHIDHTLCKTSVRNESIWAINSSSGLSTSRTYTAMPWWSAASFSTTIMTISVVELVDHDDLITVVVDMCVRVGVGVRYVVIVGVTVVDPSTSEIIDVCMTVTDVFVRVMVMVISDVTVVMRHIIEDPPVVMVPTEKGRRRCTIWTIWTYWMVSYVSGVALWTTTVHSSHAQMSEAHRLLVRI